jgi:hypothetical protein
VDGAIVAPSFVSSPWIRRYPHCRFSEARRTATRAMLRRVGGRPGLRRLLESYFLATSLRCQASSVGGVTGKMPVHCWRGMNRASAANQARSAGSYRTRPTCRRSTAFSCRSISSSASFAASPRNTRTPRQAILCCTRPANHHHASHAARNGRSTPPNRVFGRHKVRLHSKREAQRSPVTVLARNPAKLRRRSRGRPMAARLDEGSLSVRRFRWARPSTWRILSDAPRRHYPGMTMVGCWYDY